MSRDDRSAIRRGVDRVAAARRRYAFAAPLLFSPGTRRRLKLSLLGSIGIAIADTLGVVLVLPLMELIAGQKTDTGFLGHVSSLFGDPSKGTLALILGGIVLAAFLVKDLATIAFRWWLFGFIFLQEAETSAKLLKRFLDTDFAAIKQRSSARVIRSINDSNSQTYGGVVMNTLSIITQGANVLGIVIVLLIVKPIPAVLAALYFGVASMIIVRTFRRRSTEAGDLFQASIFSSYQAAIRAIGSARDIKVRQKVPFFVERYTAPRLEVATAKRTTGFLAELPRYIFEILFIGGVSIFVALTFIFDSSAQRIGVLALFVAAGSQIVPSAMSIVSSISGIRSSTKGLDIVIDELSAPEPAPGPAVDDLPRLTLEHAITVSSVAFRYPDGDDDVLRDVSLEIPVGSSLAVVGPSGAGKSTLVDVLLGLLHPTRGAIFADGVDIASQLPSWQVAIGMVPQEVTIIDGTLSENIAFGERSSEVDELRLARSVELAQLGDLVSSLPLGLETPIGERGTRLSGGQRQRVGMARALYIEPKLLILDEATSSLDNETERKITTTLDALRGEVTVIVIAHRLSTVKNCDQLAFLNDGRVESVGSFLEVREENARFSLMVELGTLPN